MSFSSVEDEVLVSSSLSRPYLENFKKIKEDLDSKTDSSGVSKLYYKNGSSILSQVYDGINYVDVTSNETGYITSDGNTNFSYDLSGNMTTSNNVIEGLSGIYRFDFFNQRVRKIVSVVGTYFVYNNGNVISEHIYFGLRPVGLYKNGQMMTVHTDYLGTPREIRNGSIPVWKWENKDIFGGNLPSLETITYNLRFSGQYFDKENKLHYNINRTYNPKWGRYMQSDPMGLAAGFNTYNYVDNNPMNFIDPLGLFKDKNFITDNKVQKDGYIYGRLTLDHGGTIEVSKLGNLKLNDSEFNYTTNCHGTTFADGKYWINDDQVSLILYKDFKEVDKNDLKDSDIGIRYADGKIVHSFTVTNSNIGITYEKSGKLPGPGYLVTWGRPLAFTNSIIKYYRKK